MTETKFTPTPDPTSPTGVTIPADLDDCFRELDSLLPASEIEGIRAREENNLMMLHFGLGMWLRNNWGLWSEWSRLKKYFNSLGVNDPDNMSSVIVESYWRYLNGLPIELPRQFVYGKIAQDEIKNGPKTGNLS